MTTTLSKPAPAPADRPAPPQPNYRRLILPIVLTAPVLLLVVLTEVRPTDLGGGLLGFSGTQPGEGARAVVIAASVSSLLGMLICRWRRWWGLALVTWPFLLILVTGAFVWAWLPALVGVAVIAAVDDWRLAIPVWAISVAVGVWYCLGGITALILGGPVRISVRYETIGPGGPERADLGLTVAYLAAYVWLPTVAVLVAIAVGMIHRSIRERRGADATLRQALATESVTSERARVARDLHDVVAHHISLVAVRAESAPFTEPELSASARAILAAIADDARRALSELRQVLTVLERSSAAPAARTATQPGGRAVADRPGQPSRSTSDERRRLVGRRRVGRGRIRPVPGGAGGAEQRAAARPGPAGRPCLPDRYRRGDGDGDEPGGQRLPSGGRRSRLDRYAGTSQRARGDARHRRHRRHFRGDRDAAAHLGGPAAVTIRVVVADDQEVVRAGFAAILAAADGIEVVGTAADGAQLVREVESTSPDVAVVDVRMPGMDGITATRTVCADHPDTRVLILTTFDLDEYVFDALQAGASGFLLKDARAELLVEGVRAVADGSMLFGVDVTRRLVADFAGRRAVGPPVAGLATLTAREQQVLLQVARGRSNAEIAAELVISEETVKSHVSEILRKMQRRNRVQLVIAAYEAGLVEPGAWR